MKVLRYLRRRFNERSTWAAIVSAIVLGSALTSPYSWLAICAAIIGTIIIDGKIIDTAPGVAE